MTGGFLRVPIMRPNHCSAILHVSILAGLLLTLNADNKASDCEDEVTVFHNTIYGGPLGEDLEIHCSVAFCNHPPPTVSWYKREHIDVLINVSSSSHMKSEWETLNQSEGRSILIFQKLRRSDSGVYQCKSGGSVSHNIRVTVHDDGGHTNVTQKNDTTLVPEPTVDLWMYMYVAAGIVAFVVTVIIISVVSMQGCTGKPKKETQTENQYVAIPMAEQPFPQPSQGVGPFLAPTRRSTQRRTAPSQPDDMSLPTGNEQVYGKMEEDGERQGDAAEDKGSSVVYAALNHQLPAGGAARPRRPKEEPSEYAAVRVKDPSPTRLNYY